MSGEGVFSDTCVGFKGNDSWYSKIAETGAGMTSSYNMYLPASLPGTDSYLKCDTNGNLTWVTIP